MMGRPWGVPQQSNARCDTQTIGPTLKDKMQVNLRSNTRNNNQTMGPLLEDKLQVNSNARRNTQTIGPTLEEKIQANSKTSHGPIGKQELLLEEHVVSLLKNTFQIKKELDKSIRYTAVSVTKAVIPSLLSSQNYIAYLDLIIQMCYD
eukprot:TRINITY_DN13196_c0_g1_i2.p1 TRINITY_DN13196_c0_g1~~TRINITY_DN13196_c0_g1_i2.p1  ORF type:complete len:148 (-),score=33.94 TRINITY_DN13196_c0_g1_i2:2-445(-)